MSPRTTAHNPFVKAIALIVAVARRSRFRVALIGGFALPFHGVQRATGDVDFLAEADGADALHAALLQAGTQCLHRSADAANYAPGSSGLAPVDFIYARRERALEMLRRSRLVPLYGARIRVPVADAEAIIGLKLQAIVNAPARRAQDAADIRALVAAKGSALDQKLLHNYYALFGKERELDRLLREMKKR